jgi:hypothetical protein
MRWRGPALALVAFVALVLAGCGGLEAPPPGPTPQTWNVVLMRAGVEDLLGSITDLTRVVTDVEVLRADAAFQLTDQEQRRLEETGAVALSLPDSANGFVAIWRFGSCSTRQTVVIRWGTGQTIDLVIDTGPAAHPVCDLALRGTAVQVTTSQPVAIAGVVPTMLPRP